jgi:hypothetical protein
VLTVIAELRFRREPPFSQPIRAYIKGASDSPCRAHPRKLAITAGGVSTGESMDPDTARTRAEAAFRKEQQAREGAKAWVEYEAGMRATQEKTARLRALRLAKEALAKEAADKETGKKSRAR